MNDFLSLYIHIPFCKSKCHYCDFTSGFHPQGPFFDEYISLLCQELEILSHSGPLFPEIKTVYIGGGTPSLLSRDQLSHLFQAIHEYFNIQSLETTLEANPEDVTMELAGHWRSLGIDRVSLGFQSMEEGVLSCLGRRNSPETNRRAFFILRESGFKNISVDAIASVTGEDLGFTLGEILKLQPEHISVYQLSVEEKTLLKQRVLKGEYQAMSDAEQMDNYWMIADCLEEEGYRHYEISNFSKSLELVGKHNSNYWNYGCYLGAGLGASGYYREKGKNFGKRWTNEVSPKSYREKVKGVILPEQFEETIDRETAIREYLMLGLRKIEGIRSSDFSELFSAGLYEVLPLHQLKNLSEFIKADTGGIRLTRNGISIANTIIRELWDVIDRSGK